MELSEKLLKEQEQIEQEIKLFMGEHEAAENASYRVSCISKVLKTEPILSEHTGRLLQKLLEEKRYDDL